MVPWSKLFIRDKNITFRYLNKGIYYALNRFGKGIFVQLQLMSEKMWCLFFCSCVSLLRMVVSRFIHVPTKDTNSSFYGCIIHSVHVLHFPCPVYHQWACGLIPGLCYCKQCCNEHSCACVLIVERFIILWIYAQ